MGLGEGIPVPFHLDIKEIGKFWIVLVIIVLCCVIECIVSLTKGFLERTAGSEQLLRKASRRL